MRKPVYNRVLTACPEKPSHAAEMVVSISAHPRIVALGTPGTILYRRRQVLMEDPDTQRPVVDGPATAAVVPEHLEAEPDSRQELPATHPESAHAQEMKARKTARTRSMVRECSGGPVTS